ncbi:hypothetical protein ACMA1D_30805 [Streptomyces sp. 796.1]|uniref:hypothetical protein n=1 Tax=Streptomyces sp. 796.1 TaxID=3163029 RepID=UPI0039C9924E
MNVSGDVNVRADAHARADVGAAGAAGPGGQSPTDGVAPVPRALAREALAAALAGRYAGELRGPAAGAGIAHPNGFLKLPLARYPADGRRLFLHVWQDGGADAQIHDHRWDFAATVLAGAVRNTVVEVGPGPGLGPDAGPGPSPDLDPDPDPDAYHLVRYRPESGGFRFTADGAGDRGGRVRVVAARTRVVGVGEAYAQSACVLHRVAAEPGTLTLVARGEPVRAENRVLVRGPVVEGFRAWRYVSAEERVRHLRAALELVG